MSFTLALMQSKHLPIIKAHCYISCSITFCQIPPWPVKWHALVHRKGDISEESFGCKPCFLWRQLWFNILFSFICIHLHTEKQYSRSSWDYVAADGRPKQVRLNRRKCDPACVCSSPLSDCSRSTFTSPSITAEAQQKTCSSRGWQERT